MRVPVYRVEHAFKCESMVSRVSHHGPFSGCWEASRPRFGVRGIASSARSTSVLIEQPGDVCLHGVLASQAPYWWDHGDDNTPEVTIPWTELGWRAVRYVIPSEDLIITNGQVVFKPNDTRCIIPWKRLPAPATEGVMDWHELHYGDDMTIQEYLKWKFERAEELR